LKRNKGRTCLVAHDSVEGQFGNGLVVAAKPTRGRVPDIGDVCKRAGELSNELDA
jgi:hypothetical protein